MSGETIKVKSVEDSANHVRISVDAAGEEARGVTVDAQQHIMEVAEAAGLRVTIDRAPAS